MIDFTVGTQIARERNEAFAMLTDPATLASWQTNTVSAVKETEGPMAVGSRIREVHRGPVGKEFAELVEVIRYEPGRAFDLHVVALIVLTVLKQVDVRVSDLLVVQGDDGDQTFIAELNVRETIPGYVFCQSKVLFGILLKP